MLTEECRITILFSGMLPLPNETRGLPYFFYCAKKKNSMTNATYKINHLIGLLIPEST